MGITRRDFLNGVAVSIGTASLGLMGCRENSPPKTPTTTTQNTPTPTPKPKNYPPAKDGLRGNHDGSFEVAHELSWQKKQFDLATAKDMGEYDLVVVGAGISGLTSAYLFKDAHPNARILILDNHDDFGGHAKRNEMHFSGGMRLTYGGSESFDSPKANFNADITALMEKLDIDYKKFDRFFDQNFNERHGLRSGIFFNKATFGESRVVLHTLEKSDTLKSAIDSFPLADEDKTALFEMIDAPKDYLGDMPKSKREAFLSGISYDTFLKEHVKASPAIIRLLEEVCLEYWGFGIDHLSAYDAIGEGYPATAALGVELEEYHSEPYIYHFPDGNASVARLLVRGLIPAVSTSQAYDTMSSMEAVVMDVFDYEQLDKADSPVQIRLNATCVHAKNSGEMVELGYVKGGELFKVTARHAIMAGNHRLMPYLVPEMDEHKKTAFAQNVKVPLIYTKLLLKDWQAFKKLGTHSLYAPKSPYVLVMLDYPVSMGGYQFPDSPDEPMVVHMVRVPVPYGTGKDLRTACQVGRTEVFAKRFSDFEKDAIDQLSEIFSLADDNLKDKVLAVTVNRWSHGYSYEENILYDDEDTAANTQALAQTAIGNIHFANSDASWEPYMHGAINQGVRAIKEILNNA